MPWQSVSAIILHAGNTIINPDGMFVYDGPPAAGNLIMSVNGTVGGGTDPYGNNFVFGLGVYDNAGGFFTQYGAGFVTFGTGSLAAGWTANTSFQNDAAGNLYLNTAGGGSVFVNGVALTVP
jgi:hypothetical protein